MQLFKCIIMGDGTIGKTHLLTSYTTDKFQVEFVPMVFDNYVVMVMCGREPCTFRLFDTAGQEDYDTLQPLSYPQTDVFLICLSVVSPPLFENVKEKWVPEIAHYHPRLLSCLLGPKLISEMVLSLLRNLPRINRSPSLQRVLKSWRETQRLSNMWYPMLTRPQNDCPGASGTHDEPQVCAGMDILLEAPLQSCSYGNADIKKIIYHEDLVGFPSSAIATLSDPFALVSHLSSPSLLSSITIYDYKDSLFLIALHPEKYKHSSQFKNSDTHKTVVIPGYSSFLILEILNDTSVLALATMPVKVHVGMTFQSKSWFLYHFGTMNDSSMWSITTSSCKHVIIHDDVNTSSNIVKYLDLGSAFKFKIKVLSGVPRKIRVQSTPFLKIFVGHVFLMDVTTSAYWDETDSYVVEMEIVNRYLNKGTTTISFIIWQATADCHTSAIVMTLKSSCSYSKFMRMLPKYKLSSEDWESGQYRDENGFNIIKTLPNNYRPPSEIGKDIPTTNNFYNADPSRPKLRNYHPQSKKTGIYKQCLNKTSREDCNCTTEQKMSQNVAFSDCTEKVVRFPYPVNQYPLFLNIKDEDNLIPMEAPYLVTVSEVNKRTNWQLNQKMTVETAKMREYLEKSISDTVYNPKDLNLSITGSELYHFRVKVIPGVTFCELFTEFQIYVDNAPLPFPGRLLIASIVAVILGGIILAVFMKELFDIQIWLLLKNLVVRKNKVAESSSSFDEED